MRWVNELTVHYSAYIAAVEIITMKSMVPPFVIMGAQGARALRRLEKAHDKFNEEFLQELLVKHPQMLPVTDISGDEDDIVCIGREVPSGNAGSIDNLFLSSSGCVVVVETKLWRNPEARRKVLSQALDYVKDVVKKDYVWLESQWKRFAEKRKLKSCPLFEYVSQTLSIDDDEQTYVDKVNRRLEQGDLICMIVGDGIETRLEELVAELCKDSAHLRYMLSLVELACFPLGSQEDEGQLLVIPRIIRDIQLTGPQTLYHLL